MALVCGARHRNRSARVMWCFLGDVVLCVFCCASQVDKGTPVAIYAEDKEHAMAVGLTIMSTQEMRDVNKGIGVELLHHLNDGLWKTPVLN